jgi:hypothetical protein
MTLRHLRLSIALVVVLLACLTVTPASAQNRADRSGDPTGTAVARPASPAPAPAAAPPPAPAPAPAPTPAPTTTSTPTTTTGRGDRTGTGSGATGGSGTGQAGDDAGTVRRPDRGGDVVGRAVPRPPSGRPGGGTVIIVPGGYYPWGYGGLGFGGYGGYYDPWFGDPYGYGGGGYSGYSPSQRDDEGAVRIKVKPRDASVYADGYYVGHVDDFDGVLQKLHLSEGPHRIEIRDPKYDPLVFDVRIETDRTITYHGEMKKIG